MKIDLSFENIISIYACNDSNSSHSVENALKYVPSNPIGK